MSEYILRETDCGLATKQEIVGELVRCRDCKHRKTYVCPLHESEFNEWECDFEYYDYTVDDGFCDRGERKDNEK